MVPAASEERMLDYRMGVELNCSLQTFEFKNVGPVVAEHGQTINATPQDQARMHPYD
jgi:hypothetical protein